MHNDIFKNKLTYKITIMNEKKGLYIFNDDDKNSLSCHLTFKNKLYSFMRESEHICNKN